MTDINQLSAASSVSSGDQVPVFSISNGDARRAAVSVLAAFIASNLGDAAGNSLTLAKTVKTTPMAVAALPSASSAGAGARAAVTDATQALTSGIGAVVVGGGANVVPVFSDGTNWRIGG